MDRGLSLRRVTLIALIAILAFVATTVRMPVRFAATSMAAAQHTLDVDGLEPAPPGAPNLARLTDADHDRLREGAWIPLEPTWPPRYVWVWAWHRVPTELSMATVVREEVNTPVLVGTQFLALLLIGLGVAFTSARWRRVTLSRSPTA